MRLLLITDQGPESQHSAIRGIFDRHLRQHAEVDIVWFSRSQTGIAREPGHVILPWHYRRHGFLWRLRPPLPLDDYDIIVVRNLFPLLAALQTKKRPYRLGFWESFPHRYRRLYEARQTGRALWRKTLEYRFHSLREHALVEGCDFYLPITAHYKERFRPSITLPTHPLPMGVDDCSLPPSAPLNRPIHHPIRLLYVGAVDPLRGFDTILGGITETQAPVRLDIFTASDNATVRALAARHDPRISFHPALPRDMLLARMGDYDLGLSLIPVTPLYEVASPTKTMEYFAMGLPALMTPLPEHLALFEDLPFLFTDFDPRAIGRTLERVAMLPPDDWRIARTRGRATVFARRSYQAMAGELVCFLEKVL